MPNEVPNPIRFSQDRTHAAYDAAAAHRFWRVLVQADRVFKLFRSGFLGKASPVHFFWGSFDLAVTRFSGRPRAAASRRRARAARRGHARSLFARGEQRRVLAGQRGLPAARRSTPTPIPSRRLPRPAGDARRALSTRGSASSSCPTTRSARAGPGCPAARFPVDHLCGGSRGRRLGPRRSGVPDSAFRDGCVGFS